MTTKIKIENLNQKGGKSVRASTLAHVNGDRQVTEEASHVKPVELEPGTSVELWIHDTQSVRVEEL